MARRRGPWPARSCSSPGGARASAARPRPRWSREGARVAIGDLDEDLAKRTAKELGGDVFAIRLDVTDHAGFTAVLDEVEREVGPIDVLINNAGIMPIGNFEDDSFESALPAVLGERLRRHARHPRGDQADEAARARAHRQPRLDGRRRPDAGRSDVLREQARRRRAVRVAVLGTARHRHRPVLRAARRWSRPNWPPA